MDALQAIHTRRSIRKFEDKPVSEEDIQKIIAAGMSAPSARNAQPWQFIVIDDKELLDEVPRINPNAHMADKSPVSLLICGDLDLEKSVGYWPVDCAAAVQNLLLAAHALGLGAVWTGVWPREQRMEGFRQLCRLPENIVPHAFIPLGYPAEQPEAKDRFRPDRIRENLWQDYRPS